VIAWTEPYRYADAWELAAGERPVDRSDVALHDRREVLLRLLQFTQEHPDRVDL